MRRNSELMPNLRAMSFSAKGWGDKIHDHAIQGGSGQMLPSALAVLAANESRLMFTLVLLSGCRAALGGNDDNQARCATEP